MIVCKVIVRMRNARSRILCHHHTTILPPPTHPNEDDDEEAESSASRRRIHFPTSRAISGM